MPKKKEGRRGIMISMDPELERKIRRICKAQGMTFSGYLAHAASAIGEFDVGVRLTAANVILADLKRREADLNRREATLQKAAAQAKEELAEAIRRDAATDARKADA